MSSHVVVIDSSARRQQIKTTPGTYLRDILEEACKKFGKDPDQHVLSDNSRPPKTLDLSLTFRLAGLINGQRIQLIQGSRSPSVVNIALKLPQALGGLRLQDKFPSNTSLWLVLRKFEEAVAGGSTQKLNLTQRGVPSTSTGAGRLEYEQPIVKIMQRELADFVSLQKTLAQLGYNGGSVLLTLDFRKSGMPIEEAVVKISEYFDASSATDPSATKPIAGDTEPITPAPAGAHSAPPGQMSSLPDADAVDANASQDTSAVTESSEDVEMTPAPPTSDPIRPAEEPALIASSSEGPTQSQSSHTTPASPSPATTHDAPASSQTTEPSIAVYKPPSSSTPQAAAQGHNEADFVPTVEHAQAHQAVLARASQNRRLQSDAEIAAETQRKAEALSTVKSATIRVRFPDQMQVDLTVGPDETAQGLYGKVREMLREETLGFELRYTGAKGAPLTLEKDGKAGGTSLIKGLGWKGRVLVTMVWDPTVPVDKRSRVLKDSLVGQARELSVPSPVAGAASSSGQGSLVGEKPKEQKKGTGKGDLEAKMKKFLGFGKK